jgi:hypothetical protein
VNAIFIMTRYSVFAARNWREHANAPRGGRRWNLLARAESVEDYKRSLFSDERMGARFAMFRSVTAESLAGQQPCDADLYYLILTSADMPAKHRKNLDAALRDVDNRSAFTSVVIEVPANGDLKECADEWFDGHFADIPEQRFATVRLDDDDALGASFCHRLNAHLNQGLCGYPISFAYGYEGVVATEDLRITDLRHWNNPKITAGLTFTNAWSAPVGYADPRRHIHNLGNHVKVDRANALVIDTRAPAYFKSVNEHMDTIRPSRPAWRSHLPVVTEEDFAFDEFPWMKEFLDIPTGETRSGAFDPGTATSARAKQVAGEELKHEVEALGKTLKASQTGPKRWARLKRLRRRVGRLRRRVGRPRA